MPPVKKPERERQRTYFAEWREFRGLKQFEAADRLEIDASTLSRLENGKSPYDQDILERLALLYRCDADDLLSNNPLQPDAPRLVYSKLKHVSPDLQERALAIVDALLRAS